MTIYEVSLSVFRYFKDNDNFTFEKDLADLGLVCENEREKRALVKVALGNFEKNEFLKHEDGFWFLCRPFNSEPKEVEIPNELALKIAETINIFCDVIGDDSDKCNPDDMKPRDIYNLTVICDHLIDSQKSVDN
jgi:hypothetical protein